ncbi:AraC family transcriptional regulator [Paenibacillus sp. J5C_2022]|uniref:AraC family transcriptional regulator n=1 Tax=Paenibacillus sp. J5C2022 TaxID=2977129 RepID=UPI0021CEC8BC|nr:AraC family transcriptional regulator [Paenibacillus sp. J5C2022]MCU6709922.1 AraC family transcriptional regulator [Paenibacillus sp. J5C2022]
MSILSVGYSRHTRVFFRKKGAIPFYLLRLQTEGFCVVEVGDTPYMIRPGNLLLCSPDDSYQLDIKGNDKAPCADYYLSIDPADNWIAQWWSDKGSVVCQHIGINDMLISIWKHLIYEKQSMCNTEPDISTYLTRCLLLHVKRLLANEDSDMSYESSIANRMKFFIEKHATESRTLPDIAAAVGLSVSRASQLFKEAFGQSVMDYMIDVRLSIAKERMLIPGMTLQEIAYQCGFAHYTHFNRLFRSRFQLSPSEYKKQAHSDGMRMD